MRKRKLKQNMFVAACTLSALITASLLIIIVGFIFMRGYSELNLKFLTTPEFTLEGAHMGIANAIVGTLILSITSVLLATPLAIAVAIYLAEYAKENIFTKTLRFLIDLLAGIPAIVIGAVGFLILVVELRYITGGFSLIAGMISLSILVMPTIERTAEEALKRTPRGIKEASYSLGSTKWEMIKRIVIPYSFPGIVTGIILGLGRAAEESAVIALTAGYSQAIPRFGFVPKEGFFMNTKLAPFQEGIGSLPITVYNFRNMSQTVPIEKAFAAATVLIFVVMLMNLSAKLISKKLGMAHQDKM